MIQNWHFKILLQQSLIQFLKPYATQPTLTQHNIIQPHSSANLFCLLCASFFIIDSGTSWSSKRNKRLEMLNLLHSVHAYMKQFFSIQNKKTMHHIMMTRDGTNRLNKWQKWYCWISSNHNSSCWIDHWWRLKLNFSYIAECSSGQPISGDNCPEVGYCAPAW